MSDLKEIAKDIRNVLENRRKELDITFVEEDHIYHMRDEDGNMRSNYPSVSKVLKKFYKEFPAEEIANKKANGDPEVKTKLLQEWLKAGTYSTNMGSRVHYFLEKKTCEIFDLGKEVRQPIFECDFTQILKSDSMISAGEKYLSLMKERNLEILDTEIVLGHPGLGYTGQPDKVWLVKNHNDEVGFVITDWKSNKPKNFEENQFTERMFEPYQKLPNNSLGHYFVQLPLYGKLLLKMLEGTKYENLRLFGCIIVLLKESGEYEEFRVPKEVIDTTLRMSIEMYVK